MSRLELRLLSTPRVLLDGREPVFRTRKALALLLYLAAEGGTHSRDKLAELLWPGSTSKRGRTALRSGLASIRRALGEAAGSGNDIILVEADRLGIQMGPELDLDLDLLRDASVASRTLGVQRAGEDLIPDLRSAAAAYRGEFLEGFRLEDAPEFDIWIETGRAFWRARLGEVLKHLADLEAETGDLTETIITTEAWVAQDPLVEDAQVGLITAHWAAGDLEGALSAYEEYRSALADLRMEPGPKAEGLAASIRSRAPAAGASPVGEKRLPTKPLQMPFVDRTREFGELVEDYRIARDGEPRMVAVLGEAGIGKTRLVEEFLGWATSRGADVIRGRAFEAERRLPYGPLVDALRPRLERERAPEDLLEDVWLSELSRILPELRDRYPDLPIPSTDDNMAQARLFEAVARLGVALTEASKGPSERARDLANRREDRIDQPLVIFLDDLQWADEGTLDIVRHACRRWARSGTPLLLVVGVREEALGTSNLGGWLSSLSRELPVRRSRLGPVDAQDTLRLLRLLAGAGDPGDEKNEANSSRDSERTSENLERFGNWLQEESEGRPLFIAQIVDSLLEREVLVTRSTQDPGQTISLSEAGFEEKDLRGFLPVGLRDLIQRKLWDLSPEALNLLVAGAVLDGNFEFPLMLQVANMEEVAGLPALDELVSALLLEETETRFRTAYSFTHGKVRDVVHTMAGEARRELFHCRAMEALDERHVPAAKLAHHAIAARMPEKAFHYSLRAAQEAMDVFAVSDAIGHYRRARELLEDQEDNDRAAETIPSDQLRLYQGFARACALVQDWAGAQEVYERMLPKAREFGDRKAEWEALYSLGTLGTGFTVDWNDDELLRVVRRREGSDGGTDTAGSRAGIEFRRARSESSYSPRTAREYGEQALCLARDLRQEDLIRRSEFGLGAAYAWGGLWRESVAHMEQACVLYAKSGDRAMKAQSLAHLVVSQGLMDSPTNALSKYGREATEIWAELGAEYGQALLGSALAPWLAATGDYENALEKGSEGLQAARSLGHMQHRFLSLWGLGDVYRETFALEEARSAYSEMFECMNFPARRGFVHAKLCAVVAISEEWERAYEHALEAIEFRKVSYLPATDLHRRYDIEALLRGGNTELAHESLRTFEQRTRGQKGYFRIAYLRAAAVFSRWTKKDTEAIASLEEALGLAQNLGLPGELWQIRATIGDLYAERGERDASGQEFRRSAGVVRELAAGIGDEVIRERFLSAPHVRRVFEKARRPLDGQPV